MSISAQDVKSLRNKTGAGMMDCKKALVETGGDFNKAVKKLKELGLAAADKRSSRATNDGKVFEMIKDTKAVLLELSCETDFVARNKDFISLGQKLLEKIFNKDLTSVNDELEGMVKDTIGIIKENMALRRFTVMNIAVDETAVSYIHGDGKIGVIVKLKTEDAGLRNDDKLKAAAFDFALHIAAFAPRYLSQDKVDPDYMKEQEEIFTKQVEKMDKPENVLKGILKGKLNKHLSEICMLDQGFVKDEKIKVSKVLENLSKELSSKISISDYLYYRVGEEE